MIKKYENDQPIVCKILTNAIKKQKYSHAYLFERKGYENALSIAISFSKLLLCPQNQQEEINCETCFQCETISSGNYPELKIIEPDGAWIKKEQLIELQQEFSKKAIIGSKKIYIINNADKLNASSSNSLLKFLEEPEENIIAILIVDNQYQVLKTIASRCQIISFKTKEIEESKPFLEKISTILPVKNENDTLIDIEKIENIIKFIEYYEQNGTETFLKTSKLWHQHISSKEDFTFAFELMILYYIDVLNHLLKRKLKIFNDYEKSINTISKKNTVEKILHKINVIIDLKENIRYNMNSQLLLDKLILNLGGEN